jgi:hypothetical protein
LLESGFLKEPLGKWAVFQMVFYMDRLKKYRVIFTNSFLFVLLEKYRSPHDIKLHTLPNPLRKFQPWTAILITCGSGSSIVGAVDYTGGTGWPHLHEAALTSDCQGFQYITCIE